MIGRRPLALVGCFLLIAACGRDPIERVARLEPAGLGTVSGLRVSPQGDAVAIFGTRDTPLEEFPTFGVELVELVGGARTALEGSLPAGAIVGADWFPGGSTLLLAVNQLRADRALCEGRTLFVEVSRDGTVLRTVSPSTGIDASGGIAVLTDGRVLASSRPTGNCGETNEVVAVDLATGRVVATRVRGSSPARAAGGVVLISDKSLLLLDLDSMSAEAIDTGPIEVLGVAGSDGTVLVVRGYEEGTGDRSGLYSIDLAAVPTAAAFLLPTALNRPSLNSSGQVLVGLLPGSPGGSRIAIMDQGSWQLLP